MKAFFEKNKICISIIIGAFILGGFIYLSNQPNPESVTQQEFNQARIMPPSITTSVAVVDYVVDGDTVKSRSGATIRLIGINTPETGQPYPSEAKNKLKELIKGKEVRLEKDITDKDQYNRLLRYIWLDNIFINLEMVKRGYANSYTYPPDIKYQKQIAAAEKQARESKTGIWALAQAGNSIIVSYMRADAEGNDNYNLNDEYVIFKNTSSRPIDMAGWTAKNEATHIFTFPSFYLAPNAIVALYSGSGTNTTDKLYWNRADEKYAIWNNSGDIVYLRDAQGGLVLEYGY
ncbi:MAG: hypothetical protein COX44_00290 [Candidatus Portnoybacteria bacterium CG23_combo_of_CG06-09_8_20_14_all_37_13]|uniref:Nuclease n=1 Tax=Candidatus Portnoybacteria bacterium CG23_combo_of_CG06-09_8_20_14_all_37_13 TaxID=1974819 RepID=A0A2G9YDQ7_9BACT|nr:MAG: hypothetical protein COX44_00290 [Candidatus Portnoybacteria bacterium CG23_combo_of_CG06-09_8_20_14_all_37_13]